MNVGGTRVKDLNPNFGSEGDPENSLDIHKQVIAGAGDIIALKGYTSWGIGATVAHIVRSILRNTLAVVPVSTFVKVWFDISLVSQEMLF